MRDAFDDDELNQLDTLFAAAPEWQSGAELDVAGALMLNMAGTAVPVLVRDVRDARDAAEQAIAARAVKLDATNVLIIYAGEDGPIKVADKLQELTERAKKAERERDLIKAHAATVKDIAGEARAQVRALQGLLAIVANLTPDHQSLSGGCARNCAACQVEKVRREFDALGGTDA